MQGLWMVIGGSLVFLAVVWIAILLAKAAARAEAEVDALEEGEERRNAFDEEQARPLARGEDLARRLDALRNRRNRM